MKPSSTEFCFGTVTPGGNRDHFLRLALIKRRHRRLLERQIAEVVGREEDEA